MVKGTGFTWRNADRCGTDAAGRADVMWQLVEVLFCLFSVKNEGKSPAESKDEPEMELLFLNHSKNWW